MRIVAGKFRGKALDTPSDGAIRPTSDRVRESMFNILASRIGPHFEGVIVLDLFAGTGALGVEAISRGAQFATFVDTGAEARGLIRGHIENFGLGGVSKLLKRDATQLGDKGTHQPANLVFCDPPYGKGLGELALVSALEGGWIAPDATIILEEQKQAQIDLDPRFVVQDTRTYGDTQVNLITLA